MLGLWCRLGETEGLTTALGEVLYLQDSEIRAATASDVMAEVWV